MLALPSLPSWPPPHARSSREHEHEHGHGQGMNMDMAIGEKRATDDRWMEGEGTKQRVQTVLNASTTVQNCIQNTIQNSTTVRVQNSRNKQMAQYKKPKLVLLQHLCNRAVRPYLSHNTNPIPHPSPLTTLTRTGKADAPDRDKHTSTMPVRSTVRHPSQPHLSLSPLSPTGWRTHENELFVHHRKKWAQDGNLALHHAKSHVLSAVPPHPLSLSIMGGG